MLPPLVPPQSGGFEQHKARAKARFPLQTRKAAVRTDVFLSCAPPLALACSLPLPNVLRNWWERCKSEPNAVRCLTGWVLCSVLSGCCSKQPGPGRDAASTCRTTAFSVHAFRNSGGFDRGAEREASCDVILSSPTERRIGDHGFGAFLLRMGGQIFFFLAIDHSGTAFNLRQSLRSVLGITFSTGGGLLQQ